MSEHYNVEEGRAYIHSACEQATIVNGRDFRSLCNPFSPCIGTICATCGFPDSTKNFVWADTGETVSNFRRRVRRASPKLTAWSWLIAPGIGAAIGAMIAIAFKAPNAAAAGPGAIGGVVGALLTVLFIAPAITDAVAGRGLYDRQ